MSSFQVYSPLKQGIVAILGSESEKTKTEPSLRRTLSADMSSKKWISLMEKVASSEEISISIVDGTECGEGREETEIWNSIQEEKKKKKEKNDIWSSVICQKDVESKSSYIHPLIKRSSSSLSGKSLEICTESLGSETGSDGFSSYQQSENGTDDENEVNKKNETQVLEQEEWRAVKYNYKKSPPRSFPPPLPSLSYPDGGSVRMQPHRDNGRLVLEAMSVPSQNNFRAQRQDGRLVLTLVNPQFIDKENEFEKTLTSSEEETKEEENERESLKEPEILSGTLNAHRLVVMMNRKSILLANRKRTTPITHSLPPRPKVSQPKYYSSPPTVATATATATSTVTVTAAASLNAYEYYWRSKSATKAGISVNPLAQQPESFKNSGRKLMVCKNRTANEQQQLGMSNCTCKEIRRSLLFREPTNYIITS